MKQRTHSWIAIRAIALLSDERKEKNLVKLLKPHARKASVGAWIPDMADAKRAGSGIDNHVLKISPMKRKDKRFVQGKADLCKKLGSRRAMTAYLKKDTTLSASWWGRAYKGRVSKPGMHLPNRAMGMSTMMRDLLIMGNPTVDALVPGRVGFAKQMHPEARTEDEAVAMFFFMLSHFVADCSMPLHCDARRISGYSAGIHKQWEGKWNTKVGTYFEKKNLLKPDPNLSQLKDSNAVLRKARAVGLKFGLKFGAKNTVPGLAKKHDVWLEMINVCRGSFALFNIIAPQKDYPFDNRVKKVKFDTVFAANRPSLETDMDRLILHDAVLNTAIVWKHIWGKVSSMG